MRVLAIDTSSPLSAVAVLDGDRVLAHDDVYSEQRHAEVLLPRVGLALARAGFALGEIELLAVGIGPGSFTGLRVGLATAKGLALATRIPLCGVSSLRVLARGILDRCHTALCVLDAGKGEVFAAAYRRDGDTLLSLLEPTRAEPSELGRALRERGFRASELLGCGTGLRRYAASIASAFGSQLELADAGCDVPSGVQVAREGVLRLRTDGPSDMATLEPLYLRGSDAKLPAEPLAL